jgi:hypothetical protein
LSAAGVCCFTWTALAPQDINGSSNGSDLSRA